MKNGGFIEFINTAFLVGLIAFMVFYVILGDRMTIFQEFMRTLMPVVCALIPFLVTVKVSKVKLRKFEQDGQLDSAYSYLSDDDQRHDLYVVSALPAVLIGLSLFDGAVTLEDAVQAGSVTVIAFLWHRFLFAWRHGRSEFTYRDKLWDDIISFALPVMVMAVAVMAASVDRLDVYQTVVVFGMQYGWRLFLFRRAAY
jgi:hypothetical protein